MVKITILAVVLYTCETWSLSLREEHRGRVFSEQGTAENIWTEERYSDRRLGKTA
jgi:hypothetical protein